VARGRPVFSVGIGSKVGVAQPQHRNSFTLQPGKLPFTLNHDRANGYLAPGFSLVRDTSLDQFLEACGSHGPIWLCRGEPGALAVASRAFSQPFAVIGRDAAADYCLDYPEISRRHAYLQVIAGRVFCIDLGSRTGIQWEDGPRPWGWVDTERGIRIGTVRIRPLEIAPGQSSQSDEGDAPLPISRSFKHPALAKASLEFLDPTTERSTQRVSRALTFIGRWAPCKVMLEGPEVSRFHGCLVRTPAGIWVVDLLSRRGILVNGEQVRCARLADGDELQVGPHRIRLRCGHSKARPAESSSLPARRREWGGRPGSLAASSPTTPETGTMLSPVRDGGWEPAGRTDISDALILTLLNEVGRMQQDMAETFQQALMTMCRMTSDMHREQMALIREELARLQQLTEEQRVLQGELARRPPASEYRPPLRLTSGEPYASLPFSPSCATPNVRSEVRANVPDAGAAAAANLTGPEGDKSSHPPSKGQIESDVHALLTLRLAAIQNERQGLWQKILKLMSGRSSEPIP
jgi:pSer/pThr/pTyr-binding forkhead associated (FHA) protein